VDAIKDGSLSMKRILVFIGSIILVWSLSACERSIETSAPTASAINNLPTGNMLSESPTPSVLPLVNVESPVLTIGKQIATQAIMTPCELEDTVDLESNRELKEAALDLDSSQVLADIASISVGMVFDEAGYGWKPGISYAIAKDGTAWHWGFDKENIDFPQPYKGLKNVQEVSESYALDVDGQLWQLHATEAPLLMKGMNDISAIQWLEMWDTLYMLKRNGTVWKLEGEDPTPKHVPDFENIREIHGSAFSLFMVDKAGKLIYLNGRSGGGSLIGGDIPIDIPDKVNLLAIGYEDKALIQTVKDEVYIFSPVERTIERMSVADNAKHLAVGGEGTYLFVKADGSVWGLGDNKNGILGQNQPSKVDKAIQIKGLSDIISIQAGTDHALALDAKGNVFSWGSNMTGQLGRIPLIFDQWEDMGELDDIQQVVTKLDQPYFVRKNGSIWTLSGNDLTYKINGPSNVQLLTGVYGMPITLTKDGQVSIWSERFTSCQKLTMPFQVKNMIGGDNGLVLLQGMDNQIRIVEFKFVTDDQGVPLDVGLNISDKAELAQADVEWVSRVKSWYVNNYTFLALTDDGRVYYADKQNDVAYTFKQIEELEKIKELASEFFVRYTLDPSSVWALDENGRVHEIIVNPSVTSHSTKPNDVEVTRGSSVEDGIAAISGRLRITKDGYIYEHDWSPSRRQLIPYPIHMVSSAYDYAIEGPGSHYHLLVTNNNKLAIIGSNPFGILSYTPQKVVKR
jgi:hypothetical protein